MSRISARAASCFVSTCEVSRSASFDISRTSATACCAVLLSLRGLASSEWNGDWRTGGDQGGEGCGHLDEGGGDADGAATIVSGGRRGWVRRRVGRVALEETEAAAAAAPSTTEPVESWRRRRLTLREFLPPRPFCADSAPGDDDADLRSRDGSLLSFLLVSLKAPPL